MKTKGKAFSLFAILRFLFPAVLLGEIRIGLMTDLSGPHVDNGEQCRRGYEIARAAYAPGDVVAGRNIRFLYEDSQSASKHGVTVFQKLASPEKVHAVSMISSRLGMSINPFSKRAKLPTVGLVANSRFTEENPYAFGSWWDAAIEGQMLAKAARRLSFSKAAIVSTEDEYPLSLREHFVETFQKLGGEIVLDERVSPGTLDFRGLVSRVKHESPDVVLSNLVTSETGAFLKELYRQQVNAKRFGNFFVSKKPEIEVAGTAAAEGTVYVIPGGDKKKFLDYSEKLFSDQMTFALGYGCYAGLRLLLQAVEVSPELETRADFYAALKEIKQVELLDEIVPVRGRRIVYPQVMKVIRKGEAEDFQPPQKNER